MVILSEMQRKMGGFEIGLNYIKGANIDIKVHNDEKKKQGNQKQTNVKRRHAINLSTLTKYLLNEQRLNSPSVICSCVRIVLVVNFYNPSVKKKMRHSCELIK